MYGDSRFGIGSGNIAALISQLPASVVESFTRIRQLAPTAPKLAPHFGTRPSISNINTITNEIRPIYL